MADFKPMSERLVVFARYPVPGQAKTRLIPALGADGAACLYQQLAEQTVRQCRLLRAGYPVALQIQYAGGDEDRMRAWLGPELDYRAQKETGHLGDRMHHAFQTAFQEGVSAVVVIGTDCPELDAPLLEQAFNALQQQDLVLGPAVDGGYYLIGLRQDVPQLFQDIAWSTSQVLAQTINRARPLGLAIALLPQLRDMDTPADLAFWQPVTNLTRKTG